MSDFACDRHDGMCSQIEENTMLTKNLDVKVQKIMDALLGTLASDDTSIIAKVNRFDKIGKRAASMAFTACGAFIFAACAFIWAIITHQISIGVHP